MDYSLLVEALKKECSNRIVGNYLSLIEFPIFTLWGGGYIFSSLSISDKYTKLKF